MLEKTYPCRFQVSGWKNEAGGLTNDWKNFKKMSVGLDQGSTNGDKVELGHPTFPIQSLKAKVFISDTFGFESGFWAFWCVRFGII